MPSALRKELILYHAGQLIVFGAMQIDPPGLHVVHVAVEMAPICKVGGLGDVVTALGRAVQEQGHMVEVILPRWQSRPHCNACSFTCLAPTHLHTGSPP